MKLYVAGRILKADGQAVAVVGSRQMTPRGEHLTRKFVRQFVAAGYTIISGLARGVDSVAHRTALKAGGRTIAVLGTGIDIIYPPENKDLAAAITRKGALVSGFPPQTPPYPKNFLARNRLIALLAKAVLVVEGQRRSGTLSTAAWAGNSGVEVFAIPGSEATNWLIDQGATLANEPQDVIDYLKTCS